VHFVGELGFVVELVVASAAGSAASCVELFALLVVERCADGETGEQAQQHALQELLLRSEHQAATLSGTFTWLAGSKIVVVVSPCTSGDVLDATYVLLAVNDDEFDPIHHGLDDEETAAGQLRRIWNSFGFAEYESIGIRYEQLPVGGGSLEGNGDCLTCRVSDDVRGQLADNQFECFSHVAGCTGLTGKSNNSGSEMPKL
jgi:hypothetical protein